MTFGFFATLIFTILQGWGLAKQGSAVWRNRSGESVSVMLFSYSASYFFSFLLYGIYKQSIAVVVAGCLGFVHLPILIGLLKFKGFTKGEWLAIGLFGLMSPAMVFFAAKDALFLVFLFGILFALAKQVYELKTTREKGSLEPKFVIVFMAATVFWFFYALYIGSWPFMIFSPPGLRSLVCHAPLRQKGGAQRTREKSSYRTGLPIKEPVFYFQKSLFDIFP